MWCPRLLIFLFGAMMAVALPSFKLLMERSVDIPAAWNIAPSLEIEQRIPIDHILSDNIQVTGLDKVLRTFDTKNPTKNTDQENSDKTARGKRSDVILENKNKTKLVEVINDGAISLREENVALDSVPSEIRNVVLLFIVETAQDQDLWKDFKATHSFPVEGSLQSCYNNKLESTRFSLDDAFDSGSKDKENFLASNIAGLLSRVRHLTNMMTGYDGPMDVTRELEESDENSMKPEIRKTKRDIHGAWHLIDLHKPTPHASPLEVTSVEKEDGANADMWDMFDVLSRIKIALFRTLLEFFGRNIGASENTTSSRESHPLRSNFVDLVGKAIRELKSIGNDKCYMLVAAAPGNELASIVELLQREVTQDTLLVVTGVCSQNAKPIPFFAQGPAAKMLQQATTIWDLPTVIRKAVTNGFHDIGYRVRRHHAMPPPFAPLRYIPQDPVAKRRMVRDKETVENSSDGSKSETLTSPKKPIEEKTTSDKTTTTEKGKMKGSTASEIAAGKFNTLLATTISVVATITLSSI